MFNRVECQTWTVFHGLVEFNQCHLLSPNLSRGPEIFGNVLLTRGNGQMRSSERQCSCPPVKP
jgi:hypothetical protein